MAKTKDAEAETQDEAQAAEESAPEEKPLAEFEFPKDDDGNIVLDGTYKPYRTDPPIYAKFLAEDDEHADSYAVVAADGKGSVLSDKEFSETHIPITL